MAFLTIGGVTVKATRFQRRGDEGPELRRTANGSLRNIGSYTARVWEGEVFCADDAEAAAVRAKCSPSASVAVTGDALGASITCRAIVTDDRWEPTGNTWYRMLSLTLRESL